MDNIQTKINFLVKANVIALVLVIILGIIFIGCQTTNNNLKQSDNKYACILATANFSQTGLLRQATWHGNMPKYVDGKFNEAKVVFLEDEVAKDYLIQIFGLRSKFIKKTRPIYFYVKNYKMKIIYGQKQVWLLVNNVYQPILSGQQYCLCPNNQIKKI